MSVTEEVGHVADHAAYNAFVASATLATIDVIAISGERVMPGDAEQTSFSLAAGYQIEKSAIHYRFDAVGTLIDAADVQYGTVSASVVVVLEAAAIPDAACIELFGGTSAAMMAHPYLREALASTAQRLGFSGVTLPLLTRNP